MKPRELLEDVQTALKALVWQGTANPVFGEAVYIVPLIPIEQITRYMRTSAFILDQGEASHPEHWGLIIAKFSIVLYVENFGEEHGQSVMIGGNRVPNDSRGAGVKDIEEQIMWELLNTSILTTKIVFQGKSRSKPQNPKGANIPNIFKLLNFEAFVSIYP